MTADILTIIERAKASGQIRVTPPRKIHRQENHYAIQKAAVDKACAELIAEFGNKPCKRGSALIMAKKHGVDPQVLRNAMCRKRGGLKP